MSDLDARMKEAGMIPLSELLERDPLGGFAANNGVRSIEDFEKWVSSKHEEFLRMRMKYELGDHSKEDDLYEWVFAHSAVFGEVAANLRQALGKPV